MSNVPQQYWNVESGWRILQPLFCTVAPIKPSPKICVQPLTLRSKGEPIASSLLDSAVKQLYFSSVHEGGVKNAQMVAVII